MKEVLFPISPHGDDEPDQGKINDQNNGGNGGGNQGGNDHLDSVRQILLEVLGGLEPFANEVRPISVN